MKLFTSLLFDTFLYVLFTTVANAQLSATSAFRTLSATGVPTAEDVSINRVSRNNAWYGASFAYKVTGDNEFDDNFLFNTGGLYNIRFDSIAWNFPIVGDISIPTDGSGGINETEIGIYPWRIISKPDASIISVLHAGFAYRVSPEEKATISPQEFEVSIGMEFTLPIRLREGEAALPFTLSVVPTWSLRNLERDNRFGLDGTLIFPVAPNLGIIGDIQVPFQKGIGASFSTGVITNGAFSNL